MNAKSLGAVLVLVGIVGAAACDAPTSPSPSTSSATPTPAPAQGEIPTTLTITGSTSSAGEASWSKWFSMVPGETATFRATATFADGTERDVTASATWTTSEASGVGVLSPGVLRAEVAGWTPVQAIFRSGQVMVRADVLLRVAPQGAFLLDVSVTYGGWEIPDALVRVISDAGTFSRTTIAVASVSLPAVGDTVVEVVAGAGVPASVSSSLSVRCDTFADCDIASGSCRFTTCEK
jgi:hypothetical protein